LAGITTWTVRSFNGYRNEAMGDHGYTLGFLEFVVLLRYPKRNVDNQKNI
jgi:hypothetical protein